MKQEKWWQRTFGKEYLAAFDDIYSSDRAVSEVDFIVGQIGRKKGQRIIDLACGQGRHAIEFAKLGFRVVGIDYSPDLLRVARGRARQQNITLKLIKGDMKALKLTGKFDDVVLLGNAFGYFNDRQNEQVVSGISRRLKNGGVFVLDLANTVGLIRNPITKSDLKIPDGEMIVENTSFDPATFFLSIRWTIRRNKKPRVFEGRLRLYTLPEIRSLLSRHGLSVKRVFGDLRDRKFDINSPRCVIFAEKITA